MAGEDVIDPNIVCARGRVWFSITCSRVMCCKPRFFGTNEFTKAILTDLIARRMLDRDALKRETRILLESPNAF